MTAQRPALADVLAVLTTYDNAAVWRLLLDDRERVIDRRGVRLGTWPSSIVPWAHATPADAIGALVEAALLPEHWARELTAPRWWCERCKGKGVHHYEEAPGPVMCSCMTYDADGYRVRNGHTPVPPSHAALVADASLGVDTLARAEAIVAETWPRARLVWRVMGAEELRRHHERTSVSGSGLPVVVSLEETQMAGMRWPVSWPRYAATRVPKDAALKWPALRALALTEDGKPTGLHLVALDDARVVLAVEALS